MKIGTAVVQGWGKFVSPWVLLGLLAAGGCADRTYLTKSHGRAYNEAFEHQAVNPAPKPRKVGQSDATEGLDSQESAVIARSYHHSLSGKEGATENGAQPLLSGTPNQAQQTQYMPPPSVPNGQ